MSADTVLQAMLSVAPHPKGRCRSLSATPEEGGLTETLLSALYGTTAGQWYQSGRFSVIDDGAIFLSETIHPFELAVFRCVDEGDVSGGIASVLGICSARLDLIRKAWQGSDYEVYTRQGVVTFYRAYVLLVVAEDPEPLIKAAKRAIQKGSG